MTLERILEIREFGSWGSEDITVLDPSVITPLLKDLNAALKRYMGGVNYKRVTVDDFNFQPYVSTAFGWSGSRTEIYCAIEHKTKTNNTLNSLVRLWAGPRGDYWVICAELSGLG